MLVTDEVSKSWMLVRLEQLAKAYIMSVTDEVSESWMSVRFGQYSKA